MRRIILAPSFDGEFLELAVYVEGRFGEAAANAFEDRFRSLAITLSYSPLIGTTLHGYPAALHGFVMAPCWVFYKFTNEVIVFLHIRDGRMNKQSQNFS